MKFGVSTFITDQGIRPAPLGRAVEERGFDSLLIAEHTHIPVERRSPYPGGGDLPEMYYRTLDPFVALSAAASVTGRILLGTGIALVAQRDPIVTAKEVASLDLVSGGRAVFGVGVGWNREEMENHGADPTTRGRMVNERLRAMRELWTKEKAEFHGEFVDFDPVYSWPKPVQEPHPPIYVGGAEGAFPRIAELGDAWLANRTTPEKLAPKIEQLRSTAGRDVPVTVYAVGDDVPTIEGFRDLGVERLLLYLPTLPESESLKTLDQLADVASRFAE
ncbi:probable F420-dependent oxidoreductase, Rv2161c family [Streptomyces sp. WMMB 714]|uniref:LLM class F420-dependent oxidoreductase n=1 Tax=Streptomyces sp. WMMB 714 TaxID=1286822 RepID=UPI0005F806EB|nr:LLM class F420-dependent oxidoreductase [Streptomyces sp. WMMB 714]SCK31966.1 probable F420-dependent oxidoreductase, Rv2161c family [Streptomyces sp. WMMB 714]